MKIYDFGGMDTRHRAFRSLEPDSGHPVTCIANSPNGDRFVVATGTSHCIVYDREGTLVIKFSKGDMYLRDLSHTKGHTMEVTCIQWHPIDKNLIFL
jgi:WD40 repeat protein